MLRVSLKLSSLWAIQAASGEKRNLDAKCWITDRTCLEEQHWFKKSYTLISLSIVLKSLIRKASKKFACHFIKNILFVFLILKKSVANN